MLERAQGCEIGRVLLSGKASDAHQIRSAIVQ